MAGLSRRRLCRYCSRCWRVPTSLRSGCPDQMIADLSLKRGGDVLLSARLTVGLKVAAAGQAGPSRTAVMTINLSTGPITIALHFVNVAQHLYVRRGVPQRPPACGNAARLQRSVFGRR